VLIITRRGNDQIPQRGDEMNEFMINAGQLLIIVLAGVCVSMLLSILVWGIIMIIDTHRKRGAK